MVLGAHPQPPPSEVFLLSLPGWGKCALGRLLPGALTRSLVPTGPVQVARDAFNGVLKQPGNTAFCRAGLDWWDLSSNMEPTRERKSLQAASERSWGNCLETTVLTLTSQGQKLPCKSQDKEKRKAQANRFSPEMYFGNQNWSMKCTGVSGMAVTC